MPKKLEEVSTEFLRLIHESTEKGFFIEALCLVLQFVEYGCFVVFLNEISKKNTPKNPVEEFKNEISMAEKNSSFLIFTLFLNGLMDYELYKSYSDLKQTRNRLVHNLVKRTKIDYDKDKLERQLMNFLVGFTIFMNKIEVPKR